MNATQRQIAYLAKNEASRAAWRRDKARGAQRGFKPPQQRKGYGSVARARGAAVTGEMKYFDCELGATTIAACTTTWVAGTILDPSTTINLGDAAVATPFCLFAPKVSAALNGRVGRKVRLLKVRLNGVINVPVQTAQLTTDAATQIRVMLVLDQQTNAAAMTGAQLMNDAGTATATINSFQNPNNFGRFRVLKNKNMTISNLGLTGTAGAMDIIQCGYTRTFKLSYTWKVPLEVNFNATNGGTVADIINNSLHVIIGSSLAGAGTFAPTVAYYSRCAYKE